MIAAAYKTKNEVKLKLSKWEQDYLKVPFSIYIDDLSDEKIEKILQKFSDMGAVRFGGRPIFHDKEALTSVMNDFRDESAQPFNFKGKTNFTIKFHHTDETLRCGIGHGSNNSGGTVYDYDLFMELVNNLECEMPLTIVNATASREMPEREEDGLFC